jgi:type IV pilus assembly protein PilC
MQPIIQYETGAILFRQLAAAVRQGAPVNEVVDILGRDPDLFRKDQAAIETLSQFLADGVALSSALLQLPELVARETAELIRAGEETGSLSVVFDALADDYMSRSQGRSTLVTASTLPAALLAGIFIITACALIFVIPAFKDVYSTFGADLPAPTMLLIGISDVFVELWWILLPGLVAAIVAYRRGRLPEAWIDALHRAVMSFGFARRYVVTGFVGQLVSWLRIGVLYPAVLSAALAHLRATHRTQVLRLCVDRIRQSLGEGQPLSVALEGVQPLPARLSLMVRLGERMQNVDDVLAQFAELGRNDAEVVLSRFERGLSTVLYILFGLTVGTIVIALYLPIFKLGSVV